MRIRGLVICCALAISVTSYGKGWLAHEEPPVFEVLPALNARINAAFEGHQIPWCQETVPYDALVTASWVAEERLVRTVQGQWSRTLCRFEYEVNQVLEGQLSERKLAFFAELRFPTPESSIKLKMLWPFLKGKSLRLRLRRDAQRLIIVSVEP